MREIRLTQGQVALVDDIDHDKLGMFRWSADWNKRGRCFYARRAVEFPRKKKLYLHREIMGNPQGRVVDHKNHDTLDCRRENLRICTQSQNMMNRRGPNTNSASGVRGVTWDPKNKKWAVQFMLQGKHIWAGRFLKKSHAITAARETRKKYFMEFGGGE